VRQRYVYRAGVVIAVYRDGELVYCAPEFSDDKPQLHMIMPDIAPYRSMIDGSEISSRSRHREHLMSHGCIEIGNETKYLKQRPVQTPAGLKQTVARLVYEKLRY
jgi:hypothetical protein